MVLAGAGSFRTTKPSLHTTTNAEVIRSVRSGNLSWFGASKSGGDREKVLEAVAKTSEHVRAALRLGNEDGKIVWWWPTLALLACKE